jgi:DNA polymerase III delta subunit
LIKPDRFLAELGKGEPPRWVVASGAEEFLRAECRSAIERVLGDEAEVLELDANDELGAEEGSLRLFDELRTGSLFTTRRLIVVKRAARLLKEAGDALARFAAEEEPQAVVLLDDDEIVKRKAKKQPKAIAALVEAGGVLVDCGTLYASPFGFGKPVWDSDLSRWVVARARSLGKNISPECAFLLHSHESAGLRGIASQLDKLVLVLGDRREILPEDVEAFVGGEKEASLFEVVDSFALRDLPRTMSALDRLYRQGLKNANGAKSLDASDISMRLLALIATRLRELGRILEHRREGMNFEEAAGKVIGAGRRWLFPKFKEQIQARTPRELGAAVVEIEELDREMKTGGSPRDLMTLYLFRHARPARPVARARNPFASLGR